MTSRTSQRERRPGGALNTNPGCVDHPEGNQLMESSTCALAEPIPHPGWCEPEFCVADDVGVTHCSAPTVVQLGCELITLRLTQTIYAGTEPGAVETLVDTANTGFEVPEAQHEWPADELLGLVAALAEMHHKARLLSGPVVGVAA